MLVVGEVAGQSSLQACYRLLSHIRSLQANAQNSHQHPPTSVLPSKASGKALEFPAIGISAQATSMELKAHRSPFPDSWVRQNGTSHTAAGPSDAATGAEAGAAGVPEERKGGAEAQPAAVKAGGGGGEAAGGGVTPALTPEVALERLEGLLRRLGAEHDPENFFQEKVRTDMLGCANYYEKIKHPMWFSLIRSKVSLARQYAGIWEPNTELLGRRRGWNKSHLRDSGLFRREVLWLGMLFSPLITIGHKDCLVFQLSKA